MKEAGAGMKEAGAGMRETAAVMRRAAAVMRKWRWQFVLPSVARCTSWSGSRPRLLRHCR